MNLRKLFLLLLVIYSLPTYSQQKEIRVQIMHNQKIMVDTTINKTAHEAKIVIENLVQKYTTENVNIDTKLTHGLYVFNIDDETWIEPVHLQKETPVLEGSKTKHAEAIEVTPPQQPWTDDMFDDNFKFDNAELDSIFKAFSKDFNEQWDETHLDIIVDSVEKSFEKLRNEIKRTDFQNTPEFQNLKNDFKEIFEKLIDTKVIIIQDGDTLKIR